MTRAAHNLALFRRSQEDPQVTGTRKLSLRTLLPHSRYHVGGVVPHSHNKAFDEEQDGVSKSIASEKLRTSKSL